MPLYSVHVPLIFSSVRRAPRRGPMEANTGSRQEPSTGTHMRPRSAIANGGMTLYCAGVICPLQCCEKNDIPLVRSPATWPNVLHPISNPSAWIMQDMAFCTSCPTWSTMAALVPTTRNIPDRSGLQNFPACLAGQSSGVFALRHAGI